MTDTKRSAKEIFLSVIEKESPAERAALLDEACAGDAALRQEVEALLSAHLKPDNPLERPAFGPTVLSASIAERPGSMVGPYRLMEQIGEGGFGLVFVAEQQHPVKRKVALKVIKPGMDTRDVVARFEAERQALAMMDHPNIARVLDAGATETGRPYFVMELVRGIPITDYCDTNHLSPRERLELFITICQAVQHAHQKGIIHRDLKPSNVLVTLHDGKPVVKVIDFGVAKALNQALTDRTIYTRFAQMIGTPLYMSPEQAEMSGLDVDTRSDVYSLGVLLYELLTGSTPFDRQRLSQAAFDEIRRIIREEEPPKPSTRLSQSGALLPSLAALRRTEPARLSRMFHGDLDWITMKALEKDRTRRYETANAFAADILRHLNDEPVEASPPSTVYRLRKFTRKHRGPVIVASAIVAALLLGIVGTTTQMYRARAAETTAQDTLGQMQQQVEKAKDSLLKAASAIADPARQGGPDAPPLIENLTFADESRKAIKGTIRIMYPDDGKSDPTITLQGDDDGTPLTGLEMINLLGQFAINMTTSSRTAQRDAETERAKAQAERDRAERYLANGILRPIGLYDLSVIGGAEHGPAELNSLAEWAAIPESRLKLKVLEVALDDPETALRVALRAERVIQASIGLSPTRRDKALELVSAKQRDMGADPRVRIAACWLALELGSADLPAFEEGCTYLSRKQNQTQHELEKFVEFAGRRRDPRQIDSLFDSMMKVLGRSHDPSLFGTVSGGLTELAPRMRADQVARFGDFLIANLATSTDGQIIALASNMIEWLAPRLTSEQWQHAYEALIAVLQRTKDHNVLPQVNRLLAALAPRLEPAQIARLGDLVMDILQRSPNAEALYFASEGLVAGAGRLEPEQAARAWDTLDLIRRTGKVETYAPAIIAGMVVLAPRLPQERVDAAWDTLDTLYREFLRERVLQESNEEVAAKEGLVALAPRLSPAKVAQVAESLAAVFSVEAGDDWSYWHELLRILESRLEPAQVEKLGNVGITLLEGEGSRDEGFRWRASDGLAVFAARLDAAQATRAVKVLVGRIEKSASSDRPYDWSERSLLAALAPRLEPAQVAIVGEAIIRELRKPTDEFDFRVIKDLVPAYATRFEAAQAARVGEALVATMEKMVEKPSLQRSGDLKQAITAFAPRFEPPQIARAWTALIAVLEATSDTSTLGSTRETMAVLAPHLEPAQVASAAQALIAIFERVKNDDVSDLTYFGANLSEIGKVLGILAPRMEGAQRTHAAKVLVDFVDHVRQPGLLLGSIDGLARLAPWLEPIQREDAAVKMINGQLMLETFYGYYPLKADKSLPLLASSKTLARLLSHPGCVAGLREACLARFEELVLHEGRPVLLNPEAPDDASPEAQANGADSVVPRRMPHPYNAAAWIRNNWSDFDLEAEAPATWGRAR